MAKQQLQHYNIKGVMLHFDRANTMFTITIMNYKYIPMFCQVINHFIFIFCIVVNQNMIKPTEQHAALGGSSTIHCFYRHSVNWRFKGDMLSPNEHFYMTSSEKNTQSLLIFNITRKHYGEYTCERPTKYIFRYAIAKSILKQSSKSKF